MPTYTDYGIVLNSYPLSERDKIFNIYTKENGLVRSVAKGIKKQGSKFAGKIDKLSCLFFQFAKGKNLDIICEVEEINHFANLRKDTKKLFTAILFLEIVNNFAEEGEAESNKTYSLLYHALNELQSTETVELLALIFIFKFISLHGFKPQFNSCVSCSKPASTKNMFSTALGGLLCEGCSKIEHKIVPANVINLLMHLEKGGFSLEQKKGEILLALKLLQEHLNTRAKKEIKSFDIVFSL